MRILAFVSEYTRAYGAQRSFMHMMRNLPSVGFEPVVVMPGEGRCTALYREAGLDVRVIPGPPITQKFGTSLLSMPLRSKAQVLLTEVLPYGIELRRFARRENLALLHTMTIRSTLAAGIVPAMTGLPVVADLRGMMTPYSPAQRVLYATIATRMLAVASSVVVDVPAFARSRCVTVHDAIDESAVQGHDGAGRVRSELGVGPDDVVVTMIGSITPAKGQHHLIEAMHLARSRFGARRVALVIVGSVENPVYGRHLHTLVETLGLGDVHFVNWTPNPYAYHCASDILVLPSITREVVKTAEGDVLATSGEGLPRTLLEAMYLGRAVVAYDMAGVREAVDDGASGRLVPEGDRHALADALVELATDPEKRARMGAHGAVVARARFSTAELVRKVSDVYREVLR